MCNIHQYAGLWPADLPKYTQFSLFVEIKKNYKARFGDFPKR